jgi:hypothetical protein
MLRPVVMLSQTLLYPAEELLGGVKHFSKTSSLCCVWLQLPSYELQNLKIYGLQYLLHLSEDTASHKRGSYAQREAFASS